MLLYDMQCEAAKVHNLLGVGNGGDAVVDHIMASLELCTSVLRTTLTNLIASPASMHARHNIFAF